MIVNSPSVLTPPTSGTYDYNAFQPGAAGFPALAGTFTDPVFGASDPTGSVLKRLTADTDVATSGEDIYGHHWANADGTSFFYKSTGGSSQVRKTSDGSVIRSGVLGNSDRSWHPTDPDKYFYFSGAALREYTVSAGTSTLVHTFPATLSSLGGSLDFVDRTGRYFVVIYNSGGIAGHVYDRIEDAIYTGTTNGTITGGYFTISPDGAYALFVNGGTFTAYALDHSGNSIGTGFKFWEEDAGDHAGFVSASDGKTYLLRQDNHLDGHIYVADIRDRSALTATQMRTDTGVTKVLSSATMWARTSLHISGVGLGNNKDWVLLSTEDPGDAFDDTVADWVVYEQEIIAINAVTHEVRRLCHHRSRDLAGPYDNQPRVSTSWDGSLILWASNFNDNDTVGYIDFWGIQNAFGAAGGPPPITVPFRRQHIWAN